MPTKLDTDDLLAQYAEAARGTDTLDPEINNKWADKLHRCYKQLRTTEEGRNGISRLIADPNPHVRAWAAAHTLMWAPEIARPALEELRDSDGPCSFDAKWTLIEFDKGALSYDN
jgi:hypothetical protein